MMLKEADRIADANIEWSDTFLAVITKHYVQDPSKHREIRLAQAFCKPLFALVEKGVDWGEFKGYPWVKVFEFKRGDDSAINTAIMEMDRWLKENVGKCEKS